VGVAHATGRNACATIICLSIMLATAAAGCAHENRAVAKSTTRPTTQPTALHIHLPGIGGYRSVDRGMLRGLREGGYDERIRVHDWPGADAGLAALLATQRHKDESKLLAQMIREELEINPETHITVSAHSAGAGIIAWALEQLPADKKIDTLLLIAPALSPTYDLSRAMSHVRGKVYVIYSPYDSAVLGMGTKMFGTVDGVKVEAAGKVGFKQPPKADKQQYEKLVQIAYRSEWVKLGNIGDHIGGLSRPFAKTVLAPLLERNQLPETVQAKSSPAADSLSVPPPLPGSAPAPAPAPATMPAAPAGAGQ
jgi:hypothetical protein